MVHQLDKKVRFKAGQWLLANWDVVVENRWTRAVVAAKLSELFGQHFTEGHATNLASMIGKQFSPSARTSKRSRATKDRLRLLARLCLSIFRGLSAELGCAVMSDWQESQLIDLSGRHEKKKKADEHREEWEEMYHSPPDYKGFVAGLGAQNPRALGLLRVWALDADSGDEFSMAHLSSVAVSLGLDPEIHGTWSGVAEQILSACKPK